MSFSDILKKKSHIVFFSTADRAITDVGFDDFRYVTPLKRSCIFSHHTLHYVLNGSGNVRVGGKEYTVRAGEGFVLPSEIPVFYEPTVGDEWSYIWFGLACESVNWLSAAGFTADTPVFSPKDPEAITRLLTDMLLKVRSPSLTDYLYAKATFLHLMSILCEERSSLTESVGVYHAAVNELLCLIDANYNNPSLSVSTLCDIVHLSHSYLCKIFPRVTGRTIKQAIIDRRMTSARLLLSEGKGVKEAAERSGYSDVVHFSKEFLRYFGVTPGKYRTCYYTENKEGSP